MAGFLKIDFLNIGTYALSLVTFLLMLAIFINIRIQKKNKEIIIFFTFVLIIVSDILCIKNIIDPYLNLIIINFSFFIISSVVFKDAPKKLSKFFESLGDIIFVIILTCGIVCFYILNRLISIFNELYFFAFLTYQLLLFIIFIRIFFSYYSVYPFKIGFKIKTLLLFYLLTYVLLISDFSFSKEFSLYTKDIKSFSGFDFFLINIKSFIFILFSFFGMVKIFATENAFINQFLEFTKSKKGEIKTLDIIESLVLQSEEFDSTIENILNIACELTKSDGGIIYIYDKNMDDFTCKKINGYIVPPFFVNDKILEDSEGINKKIFGTKIGMESFLFKTIKTHDEMILIQREGDEDSRKYLSELREYASNIGSMMAGKIFIDNELFGIIILEELYSNYVPNDLNIFKAICSFSGVLIKNIKSKTMEKERERLKNEMKIAEQIQTGILPRKYNIEGFSISATMKPAEEVGGDYYDILQGPDGSYWVNIGDVTGHGVTAGLIMMMLQTSSNSTINAIPDISPKDLAILSNKIIYDNVQNRLLLDQFITTCFLKFNKKGFFEYSGAHEDILILRNATDNVEILKTKGIWLGLMEDISHGTTLSSFNLYKGDVLMIFTDGVIEIRDKKNEQYDMFRLTKFFKKHGRKEPEVISQLLLAELNEFKEEQRDDITFLIIRKD